MNLKMPSLISNGLRILRFMGAMRVTLFRGGRDSDAPAGFGVKYLRLQSVADPSLFRVQMDALPAHRRGESQVKKLQC
jgi:hypothetical protein